MGQLQKAQQRRLLEVFEDAGREEQRDEVEELSLALTEVSVGRVISGVPRSRRSASVGLSNYAPMKLDM